MIKEPARAKTSENRSDIARIRKAYNTILYAILAIMFVLGPIYLFVAVYYPQWLF